MVFARSPTEITWFFLIWQKNMAAMGKIPSLQFKHLEIKVFHITAIILLVLLRK
jgi:hypothetical protein